MTDKELIKQEIERRYNCEKCYPLDRGANVAAAVLQELLLFIDSIPEPASEDLEEEIERFLDEDENIPSYSRTARHFAEWQRNKDQETIELAEDHAMLAGMEKMREEMLKNTVLETKVIMDSDGDGIETPYDEWLTLESTEILSLPDNIGLKDGDRVKIVIVKED